MWVIKATNYECELKIYEDNKMRSQKSEIAQWKNNKRKEDEKTLPLHGLLKKKEKKLINQISDFEELGCEQSLKILK